MGILVYEYFLGQELNDSFSTAMLKEARLMIGSVANDLKKYYPDANISLLINKAYKDIFESHTIVERNYKKNIVDEIVSYKRDFEDIIIIAPEEDNILYEIINKLEKQGIKAINCNSEFIKISSNKLKINNFLKKSSPAKKHMIKTDLNYKKFPKNKKIVAKIIDGIGSENLFIFNDRYELEKNKKFITTNHIFQEFMDGKIVSINIISNGKKNFIISINEQIYKRKSNYEIVLKSINIGKFNYMDDLFRSFSSIILDNFKGSYGFIGIDAILTDENKIFFLEINPRFTTSYIGLSKSLNFNPLQVLFDKEFSFDIKNNKIFEEGIHCG